MAARNRTIKKQNHRIKTIENQVIEEDKIKGMTNQVFSKYSSLFSPGLGNYTKSEFIIRMKDGVVPTYIKPRTLPLALKDKVGAEIDRLVREGVLSPVERASGEHQLYRSEKVMVV